MNERRQGSITPNFNGNLAQDLVWQEEVLNGFSNSVDLKTNVIIKDSDKTATSSTVNLGEVLAFKKASEPGELLNRKLDKIVEVNGGLGISQSEVVINHLILTEEVKKGSDRFDKEEYVRRLNSAVAKGLLAVSAEEKLRLTIFSLVNSGSYALTGGVTLGAGYLLTGHISDWISSLAHPNIADYLSLRVIEGMFGATFLYFGAEYFLDISRQDSRFRRERRGFDLVDQYNPFGHLKNSLAGNLYMLKNRQRLVALEKED